MPKGTLRNSFLANGLFVTKSTVYVVFCVSWYRNELLKVPEVIQNYNYLN